MATPPEPLPEPAAEPPVAAESPQLSLKVRTLDQKTYPITICAAASVPQLKEVVAVETGVTLARQRLIYRGRVLKNDQPLAAYSLEDGHVLHLVVRAAPPPADIPATGQGSAATPAPTSDARPAGQTGHATGHGAGPYLYSELETLDEIDELNARLDDFQRASQRARSRSRLRRAARFPQQPRDNDEPDPSMSRPGGGVPSRVLMGATISVPDGADVTMPFLSNMIADLVTQVSEGGEAAATGTADTRRTATSEGLGAAMMEAATARALRRHHRNRDGPGRQRHARRSSTGAERQEALRSRMGLRLESVRGALDDATLDFPAELTPLPQGGGNAAINEMQQQVEMLLTQLERFGTRLRLLPAALAQRDRQAQRTSPVASGAASVVAASGSSSTPDRNADPEASTVDTSADLAVPTVNDATEPPVNTNADPAEPTPNTSADLAVPTVNSPTVNDPTEPTVNTNAGPAEPTVSTRSVIRTIETLQTIGESTDLLARMARHAFVRQSMQLGESIARRGGDATAANPGTAGGDRGQAAMPASNRTAYERVYYSSMQPPNPAAPGHATTTGDRVFAAMQAAARNGGGFRPRIRVTRIGGTDLLGERNAPASRTASAAPGSLSGFPMPVLPTGPVADLRGSSTGAVPTASQPAPPAETQPSTQSGPVAATPSDLDVLLPPGGARIPIAGIGGLPLMSSVVFPFSLAAGLGGSHATTTWNLADFVSRLTSELPISTLYGIMAGDATQLHHILAHIGFGLFSGVDVPRVSRPSIRTWAQDLIAELRRLLRSNALPTSVLDEVNGDDDRRSALGNELLRVMEPFIPDLIDYLVRATSASRAAAFGTSSSAFMRTMAQQVVRQLRTYARGDSSESEDESDERLKRLLRGLLVWLGMNEHMAGFVVDSLLCWTEGDSTSSRRGRTRQREEDAGAADAPETKRRRE